MPDYLLPCTCGKKLRVSSAQAGEELICECGARVQVPTMRGLRELQPAESVQPTGRRRRSSAWEDRHRVAFLLVIAAIGCAALAGYLWSILPAYIPPPSEEQLAEGFEQSGPRALVGALKEFERGIAPSNAVYDPNQDVDRRLLRFGIGASAVTALAALVAAWFVARKPGAGKKKSSQEIRR